MSPLSAKELQSLNKALDSMCRAELKQVWNRLMGCVCYTNKTEFIRKRLRWRITTLLHGGIAKEVYQKAAEISDLSQLQERAPVIRNEVRRARAARPAKGAVPAACLPGSLIRKTWKGRTFVVRVAGEKHFELDGSFFPSLSSVASHIAGYKISGNKFFNIPQP